LGAPAGRRAADGRLDPAAPHAEVDRPLRPIIPLGAIVAFGPGFTGARLLPHGGVVLAFVAHHLVVVIIVVATVMTAVALARTVLVEARAVFVENAVIMIRELQIIFGLHAITRQLRVARHRLVLLVKLRGVAARPWFGPVTAATGAILHSVRPRAATAATAAVLSVVDQRMSLQVIVGMRVITSAAAASSSAPPVQSRPCRRDG
jgi:hypothetical protein